MRLISHGWVTLPKKALKEINLEMNVYWLYHIPISSNTVPPNQGFKDESTHASTVGVAIAKSLHFFLGMEFSFRVQLMDDLKGSRRVKEGRERERKKESHVSYQQKWNWTRPDEKGVHLHYVTESCFIIFTTSLTCKVKKAFVLSGGEWMAEELEAKDYCPPLLFTSPLFLPLSYTAPHRSYTVYSILNYWAKGFFFKCD